MHTLVRRYLERAEEGARTSASATHEAKVQAATIRSIRKTAGSGVTKRWSEIRPERTSVSLTSCPCLSRRELEPVRSWGIGPAKPTSSPAQTG